jgi:type IV fimbrial biogenesis protein FimT
MRRARGFTLIELIVLLAILAIFVTEAIPGFQRLSAHENRVSAVFSLVHALRFARAKAITTNQYVAICKSAGGRQCSSSPTTWSAGWIVFLNRNRDWKVDPGERILLRHGSVSRAVELTGNRDAFIFRPASLRSTAGSLFVCAGRSTGSAIIVSYTGRIRTSRRKAGGAPVSCP